MKNLKLKKNQRNKSKNQNQKPEGRKFSDINPKLVPEANIGMVGHVSHGKTTLTKAITGKLTLTHSEELKRGITIRLGYADATIYRCTSCKRYSTNEKCPYCSSPTEIVRTVSFIDVPGHETLMATVLTGANLMDGALFIIAANEKVPQLQTVEHLAVLNVVGIKNVIIIQSKVDLVTKEQAMKNYQEIKNFVKGTMFENAPVIPVSSQKGINIDAVLEAIEAFIPTPMRDVTKSPKMLVARSFDINKPGTAIESLSGGIVGGSIVDGRLAVGDEVEIKPGVRIGNKYKVLKTKITGLKKAGVDLQEATAGGLLGVKTQLDPYVTKNDSLVGCVVGMTLPDSVSKISFEISMLERIGVKSIPIKTGDKLLINIGTMRSVGEVTVAKKSKLEMNLGIPVIPEGRIAVSKLIEGRWKLVGYGNL